MSSQERKGEYLPVISILVDSYHWNVAKGLLFREPAVYWGLPHLLGTAPALLITISGNSDDLFVSHRSGGDRTASPGLWKHQLLLSHEEKEVEQGKDTHNKLHS